MSRVDRKEQRKKLAVVSYLYTQDGWPIGECRVLDVSDTGAKLVSTVEDPIPPVFLLSFSKNGKVRRQCHLVWTNGDQLGVRFAG
jgi:hypothetical protein